MSVIHDVKHHETPMQKLKEIVFIKENGLFTGFLLCGKPFFDVRLMSKRLKK